MKEFPTSAPQTPFFDQNLTEQAPSLEISGNDSGDYLFGFSAHDVINGGGGGDVISGTIMRYGGIQVYSTETPEGDTLNGGSGNDWIAGGGGDDHIDGGSGNDIIESLDGKDTIVGGLGNDVLAGGSHNAVLLGGEGDDALFGDGYFTGNGSLSLDNMDQYYVNLTFSPEGFANGYHEQGFSIKNDAPEAGNDMLDGGSGRDYLEESMKRGQIFA